MGSGQEGQGGHGGLPGGGSSELSPASVSRTMCGHWFKALASIAEVRGLSENRLSQALCKALFQKSGPTSPLHEPQATMVTTGRCWAGCRSQFPAAPAGAGPAVFPVLAQVGTGHACPGAAAESPSLCFPTRLKRSQDPASEPLPVAESGDAVEDREAVRPALPMCGSLCPSRLSES